MKPFKQVMMMTTMTMTALAPAATPGAASAATEFTHGSVCNPIVGESSKIDYSQFGVFNVNTSSTAKVQCHVGYTEVAGGATICFARPRE